MSPERKTVPPPQQEPLHYEPPRVERVLGPAELEREALYAGVIPSGPV
jgi:hypothetical protein